MFAIEQSIQTVQFYNVNINITEKYLYITM